MILSDKLDRLKPLVNYDNNSFVRETLEFPFDFIKAVEYALRTIGETNRIMERTFYLPTVSSQRIYELSLPNLTSKKVEFLRLLDLAVTSYDETGAQVIARVNENWFEQNETNTSIDYYELSKYLFGEISYFKSNLHLDSVVLGKYDAITNLNTNVMRISTFANATVDYNVINLERANAGDYSYQKIVSLSNPDITLEEDPLSWAVGDKVYICNGLPPLLTLVCQVVIQDGYFGDDETMTIPCPANILSQIDHFAVKFLYDLLITRDIKQAEVYMSKLKTKILKTEEVALYDIRKIINSASASTKTKSYTPFGKSGTIYGR